MMMMIIIIIIIIIIIDKPDVLSHLPYFRTSVFMISDLAYAVNQIIALLGCYAAWSGIYGRFGVPYIIISVFLSLWRF